mmetsp:Transcript_23156/g.91874  ORF Transcript_23156/g.91874 Transcript_23156/m.91874 type:complete len:303 (+) Transcript_23156:242-1150(+)
MPSCGARSRRHSRAGRSTRRPWRTPRCPRGSSCATRACRGTQKHSRPTGSSSCALRSTARSTRGPRPEKTATPSKPPSGRSARRSRSSGWAASRPSASTSRFGPRRATIATPRSAGRPRSRAPCRVRTRSRPKSTLDPSLIMKRTDGIPGAHADFTTASAAEKIDALAREGRIPQAFADARGRRAVLNVWRAFGEGDTVEHAPLCFLDPATIDVANDCFPYALAYEGRAGVNASVARSEAHAWNYFSKMTPDEVVLFFNFDDRPDAVAPAGVFHAALGDDDASAKTKKKPRLSVEARILCRW